MPIGCVFNYIIIQKSSLQRMLKQARLDAEHVSFAEVLLSSRHSDDFLIALEDMGPIDFYLQKLDQLGLKQELDFHVPGSDGRLVGWLRFASIREVKNDGSFGLVVWDGYQHVDDTSVEVVVWEDEDFPAKTRQAFPQRIVVGGHGSKFLLGKLSAY